MLKLRQVRKEKKIKQNELAERAGVSSALICLLEYGKYAARPELLLRIAHILQCEPSELLVNDDDED